MGRDRQGFRVFGRLGEKIAAEPEYGAKMRNFGLDPVSSATPEAFRGGLVAQKQVWADVVRKGWTVSRYHSLLHDFAKRGRVHD